MSSTATATAAAMESTTAATTTGAAMKTPASAAGAAVETSTTRRWRGMSHGSHALRAAVAEVPRIARILAADEGVVAATII